ncbi:hypothetical protein [Formosa algae]|uniref:hypothetical protein n=1 Tax=Formosa algae TaxID=225843 RepID=UPI000CCE708D|nr:hypothetical protein [Formosa algae]PNW27224.1 hypothetical protein BKP44_14120 [Formosa algae]
MDKNQINQRKLKVYDTSMFPKLSSEEVLKKQHLYLLNLTLAPYIRYVKFTEEYLDMQAKDYQQEHLDALDNECISLIESEECATKMLEIDNEFAQRFRESIIVQLYSFLEGALVNSCEMYYSNKDIENPVSYNFPEQAGFDDAKAFIKNNVKIELKLINEELDFFCKLKTLRNRIVHHKTSFFNDDKKKINQLKTLSKGRFQMRSTEDLTTMYFLYFDKTEFSLEIIEKIKSLYVKLGENGVYY